MTKDETATVEIEAPQVWELEIDGRLHRVETSTPGLTNKAIWWVDGECIADRSSVVDDNIELVADKDHELADELGAIKARFTGGGRPRRVTHFEGDHDTAMTKALIGSGGTDLDPAGVARGDPRGAEIRLAAAARHRPRGQRVQAPQAQRRRTGRASGGAWRASGRR